MRKGLGKIFHDDANSHRVKDCCRRLDMKRCLRSARVGVGCVLTRMAFMLHLLLLTWRSWQVFQENDFLWFLLVPVLPMLVEMAVVLYKRDGYEWRRFSPSYFFYLLGAVPAVWCIELDRLNAIRQDEDADVSRNGTAPLEFGGFAFQVTMTTTEWALALEQTMMFLLILGRWILPKGDLSREQLSQLLLVYLAMAIDILELFEIFKEVKVLRDQTFIYIVLAAFSWSLLQFTFHLTPPASRRRPTRSQVVDVEVAGSWAQDEEDKLRRDKCSFIYDEKFAIFVSLLMQDLPFLAIRIVSIAHYQVFSYANTFFTVKNAIMVLLQLYRLLVLACQNCCGTGDGDDDSVTLVNSIKNEEKFATISGKGRTNGAKVSIAIQASPGDIDAKESAEKQSTMMNGVVIGMDGHKTAQGDVAKPPRPMTGKRVMFSRPTTAIARPTSGGRPTSSRRARPVSARPLTPGHVIETAVSDDSGIGGEGSEQKDANGGDITDGDGNHDISLNNSEVDIGRPLSRGPIFFSDEKPQSALRRSVTPSRKSVTFFDDGTDSPVPTLERRSATPRPGTPGPAGRTPTPSRSRPGTPGPRSTMSSAASGRRSVSFQLDNDDDDDDDGNEGNANNDDEFSRGSPNSIATFRTDGRSVTPGRKSVTFMDGIVDNEGRSKSRISRPGTPVHTKHKQLQKVLGRRGTAKHKAPSTPGKKK